MKVGAMSTPFVKYTPGIEATDPRFDETLQTVIAKTERYIAWKARRAYPLLQRLAARWS
jgi:hypothetical protein